MNVGSLCSGCGGLDLALGLPVAWHVEYEAAPSKILAARFPDVPNHGDLTALDWAELEPVDVLTAGYPCQPFSHAGKRQGTNDARHLWPHVADAVRVLRPRLVFLENVAGHLTLGFGDVLGDLARIGYDARWCCVRASDVGAPHQRKRLFIVAYPRPPDGGDVAPVGSLRPQRCTQPGRVRGDGDAADPDGAGGEARDERPGARDARRLQPVDCRGATTPHPAHDGLHGTDAARRRGTRPQDGGVLVADADEPGPQGPQPAGRHDVSAGRDIAWGQYEPAIRRWEALTRPAPSPTDDRGRLAPVFVEWLMGLPAGWVTDIAIPRTAQLKALGNGVVPQQAAYAWSLLATTHLQEEAA